MQGDFINSLTDILGTASNNFNDGKYAEIVSMYKDIFATAGYMKTDGVCIVAEIPKYWNKPEGFTLLVTDASPQYVLVKHKNCDCVAADTDCWYPPILVGADAQSAHQSAISASSSAVSATASATNAASSAQVAVTSANSATASEAHVVSMINGVNDWAQQVGVKEYHVGPTTPNLFAAWSVAAAAMLVSLNGIRLTAFDALGVAEDYIYTGTSVSLIPPAQEGDVVIIEGFAFETPCTNCPPDLGLYPSSTLYPSQVIYPHG